MKRITGMLFVLSFIFGLSFAANKINVGEIAPDFALESITGGRVSLKNFEGNIVFLNFFATWCGPCRREVPDLVKVYSLYKNKNVKFISVNLQEDKQKVSKFREEHKINWNILLDYKGDVGRLYNIIGIPTNLVIDKSGKITFLGHFLTEDVLKKELDKVLEK